MKAFIFKKYIDFYTYEYTVVIAPNGTVAKDMLKQQFPNGDFQYHAVSNQILSLNGNLDMTVATI
jgi:hypothetical protein